MFLDRTNFVQRATLPKMMYTFDVMQFQISKAFFTELEKKIIKLIWKQRISRIAKAIRSKKSKAGCITIQDFKSCYKATMIKPA